MPRQAAPPAQLAVAPRAPAAPLAAPRAHLHLVAVPLAGAVALHVALHRPLDSIPHVLEHAVALHRLAQARGLGEAARRARRLHTGVLQQHHRAGRLVGLAGGVELCGQVRARCVGGGRAGGQLGCAAMLGRRAGRGPTPDPAAGGARAPSLRQLISGIRGSEWRPGASGGSPTTRSFWPTSSTFMLPARVHDGWQQAPAAQAPTTSKHARARALERGRPPRPVPARPQRGAPTTTEGSAREVNTTSLVYPSWPQTNVLVTLAPTTSIRVDPGLARTEPLVGRVHWL